jgi:CheY-like chemotaxis protein
MVRAESGKVGQLSGLRLLVVEDNAINQQVASELLSAEGAYVQIAENGAIGVNAIATAQPQFDAVLMDLQMPVMDGYAATQAIRNTLGPETLPIIAMTANALASDRAACLAAGMNDHVGKPFDLPHLVEVLLHYTKRAGTSAPPPNEKTSVTAMASTTITPIDGVPSEDTIDVQGALERMGGRNDLYGSVLQQYLDTIAGIPEELDKLFVASDWAGAARTLHTLKGLSATVGANYLAAVARRAEGLVKTADAMFDTVALMADFRKDVESTTRVVSAVAQGLAHPPKKVVATDAEPLDAAKFQEELAVLRHLLMQFDMKAVAVHTQLLTSYGPKLGEVLKDLNSAMGVLDFAKAMAACDRLEN